MQNWAKHGLLYNDRGHSFSNSLSHPFPPLPLYFKMVVQVMYSLVFPDFLGVPWSPSIKKLISGEICKEYWDILWMQ